jgi:hypothetical protein
MTGGEKVGRKFGKRTGAVALLFLLCLLLMCPAGVLAAGADEETASETTNSLIGVEYRGHVENYGNMPTPDGSFISGPEAIGTRGQGLRMEGFWIVTTDAYDENGLPLVIAEDAVDDTVYINGLFDSVTIYAPGAQVIMDGDDSSVGTMTVTKEAVGSRITLGTGTEIGHLEIGATTEIKGDGTVKNGDINANGVVFEKRPVQWQEQDDLDVPPVMPDEPTPTPGGSGGGGMAVSDDVVIAGQLSAVTINTQAPVAGSEIANGSSTIDHATGPVVTWSADGGVNFAAANAGDKFSAPIAYQTKYVYDADENYRFDKDIENTVGTAASTIVVNNLGGDSVTAAVTTTSTSNDTLTITLTWPAARPL